MQTRFMPVCRKKDDKLTVMDHSWEYELKEFYDCITGKISHMNGDIDDALATMQLVYTIYESHSKE